MGKLQTRWLGPYEIEEFFNNGVVCLTIIDPFWFKLLVNGHRLRLYHKSARKEELLQQFAKKDQTQVPIATDQVPSAIEKINGGKLPTTTTMNMLSTS